MPTDRCEYEHAVSFRSGVGSTCCWRPTWRDRDRCVWHIQAAGIPPKAFESQRPAPGERLDGIQLREVSLVDVDWFEECVLINGEFTDVDLQGASFARANLRETTFDSVNLSEADLSVTNLEGALLQDVNLRNATLEAARTENTRFSTVKVGRRTTFGETSVYERHLADAADTDEYLTLAQAATRAYRNIEQLYAENGFTSDNRRFYRKRKDLQRRVAWHTQDYVTALLAEGSRWVTGYGISPWRVLGSALILIVVSAVLYPITGGITETVSTVSGTQTETWRISDPVEPFLPHATTVLFKSLYFSVVTFSTLGYGDISPVGSTARAIAGLEAFLGSLLMALLVFVLSRRIS